MKRVLIMLWVLWKLLANTPLAAQAPDSVDSAGGIQLTAFLDHVEVALNREAVLTLRLEWVGDPDRYEVYTPENPFVQNLTIIGNASANRVSQHDGKTHSLQEYTFRLKPTSLGMGYVEGMIIKYRDLLLDRDFRLTTNRLEIKITDPLPDPGSKRWLLFLFLGLGLLLAVGWYWRRQHLLHQSRLAAERAAAAQSVPLEHGYLEELQRISFDADAEESVGALNQLSRLLRRFFGERYGCPGLESTSSELLQDIKQRDLNPHLCEVVEEVISKADLIKFTGRQADRHELDRMKVLIESVIKFSQTERNSPSAADEQNNETNAAEENR